MSIKAIVWSFEQEIKPASTKFVLVAFADCVSDYDSCGYPSIDAICAKTSLDRKTVIAAITRLEELGVIQDTGRRVGRTGQVKVYRLSGLKTGQSHYVYRLSIEETGEFYIGVRSCWGRPEEDQYLGSGAWPTSLQKHQVAALKKEIIGKFKTRAEAEERESKEIIESSELFGCMNVMVPKPELLQHSGGTVPVLRANSTAFPREGSQKRDTEPSVTVIEPPNNGAQEKFDPLKVELPACIPAEVWAHWIAYRRQRRDKTTEKTAKAQIKKLAEWAAAGHSPAEVIDQSITNGWQGLFEPKRQTGQQRTSRLDVSPEFRRNKFVFEDLPALPDSEQISFTE